MNQQLKFISGLAGLAGAGAAGSLQAQDVFLQNTYSIDQASTTSDLSQTTPVSIDPNNSFNLFQDSGYAGTTGKSPVSALQGNVQVNTLVGFSVDANTESPGSLVSGADSFTGSIPEISGGGTFYYGLELTEPTGPTPLYGWLEIDDTQSTPGAQIDTISIAYDNTGADVTVGVVPEPSAAGLMATGALLAGSVVIWQRRRDKIAA